jgi:phospholipase/carboxylesterase
MRERRVTLAGFETIVVEPEVRPATDIIVLHGYSMAATALSPFAHSLGVDATFYFPQAPLPASEGGWTWWPVDHARRTRELALGPRDLSSTCPDRTSVRQRMLELVSTIKRPEAPHTVLCGFSQGGMLALDLFLMEELRLDALTLFSSCLIDQTRLAPRAARLAGLPTFISHGLQDVDLAFEAGCRLRDFLRGAGAEVSWVEFDGGHEVPLPVWRQFKQFLRRLEQRLH